MAAPTWDVVVIGGGIVGVATARALAAGRGCRVLVVEAEPELARHQTGRNSGVIHSGLYYEPGSQKARLCTRGSEALYRYCAEHGIAHRRCGKLVVATADSQIPALAELERRAAANGLEGVERLDPQQIRAHEPAARGVAALWIPHTGIVDFAAVTTALANEVRNYQGEVLSNARVRAIDRVKGRLRIRAGSHEIHCQRLVNCAGLQSDRIARLAGIDPGVRLIPFRGEYWQITGEAADLVRGLIYPVPDPRFPFLGVHLTRTIDGRVLAGPNAVPALKREGYRRFDISLRDIADMVIFPGFWRLTGRLWRTGLAETRRSLDPQRLAREAALLVPGLTRESFEPALSGVRAQAIDRSGNLLDDFHILEGENMIHVLNAPSPAATAALSIGEEIADLVDSRT